MSQDPQQFSPEDAEPAQDGVAQQQQQPHSEGHAGQGSESIIQQLREWEHRRASNTGGKRRNGPD